MTMGYSLDSHSEAILDDYRASLATFERMREFAVSAVRQGIADNGLMVTALESRIKTESSLSGKLALKGSKYASLEDVTDIVGLRVVTLYTDDVDKIAAIAGNLFEIDWENSVDKRKMHQLDSFGYNSLHYICRIPETLLKDASCPDINRFRFEIQLRTTLQHMWASIYHDTGYKSDVEVPREYLRTLNRLAGMLELADDEFSRIRTSITDYRRRVQNLVADCRFEDVPLDGDTFNSYLQLDPFGQLTRRIAAINQAEIVQAPVQPYLAVFKSIGFKMLTDVDTLIRDYSEPAFELALHRIGGTDLDIISSTVAIQNLCIVYLLLNGVGKKGLVQFFDCLNGVSDYNVTRAELVLGQASHLSFMNKQ